MNKLNRQAFTLIEVLVVVIILGIILSIAIPSVANLTNSNRRKLYETHMEIVEEKTKLFIEQHKGELRSIDATCFQVNYQTLLNQEILTEADVKCSGSIIITKAGNNKNFSSDYYLNCNDKNGDSLNKSEAVPTGCTVFTGN